MLVVVFLLASAFATCPVGSKCGGLLSGITDATSDPANCSVIDISQTGGILRTTPFPQCADRGTQSTGVPKTTLRWSGGYMYWISGTGGSVWQIDVSTIDIVQWANLPSTYNYTVGLYYLNAIGMYMVTTTDIYFVPEPTSTETQVMTRLTSVANLKLSMNAMLTGDYWNPFMYIVDGTNVHTINITDNNNIQTSSSKTDLTPIDDVDVWTEDTEMPVLLALQNSSLYFVDQRTGVSKWFTNITQTGSGKLWSNALTTPDWFVSDDTVFYHYDLSQPVLIGSGPFDGKSLQGMFQFHP